MSCSVDDSELARLEKELLDGPMESVFSDSKENNSEDKDVRSSKKKNRVYFIGMVGLFLIVIVCLSIFYSEENSDDNGLHRGREDLLKKKYNSESPLKCVRPIPKKTDFAGALKEAPEIARMEYKKLRTRVNIDKSFWIISTSARRASTLGFYDRLPLVASGLAAPPILDEGLPRKSFRIQVDEISLRADAEVLPNALNLMAIARSENRAGRSQRSDLYIEQAMEVLSIGVEANVTRRRERFLRSFGEPLKVVHNFHRFPVEEPVRSADLPWNEVCPALMGPKLTTKIVEKSQRKKLTEALVKEAKAKRTHGSSKKMKTYLSKRDRTVYQHLIRVEKQLALHEESEARAGRLALFQKNWAALSKDPWVRETVQGYELEFCDQIPQCFLQYACPTDSESDLLASKCRKC
ncbi:hypothetical protein COOONC_00618 [Cooperia oncophora]